MLIASILSGILAFQAIQGQNTTPVSNKPSIMEAEKRAKIWRARTEYLLAQNQFQASRTALENVLSQSCPNGKVIDGKDGEPECEVK